MSGDRKEGILQAIDDQVMLYIKEKTEATNSSAFHQQSEEIKRETLIALKESGASLCQQERLTGTGM